MRQFDIDHFSMPQANHILMIGKLFIHLLDADSKLLLVRNNYALVSHDHVHTIFTKAASNLSQAMQGHHHLETFILDVS